MWPTQNNKNIIQVMLDKCSHFLNAFLNDMHERTRDGISGNNDLKISAYLHGTGHDLSFTMIKNFKGT